MGIYLYERGVWETGVSAGSRFVPEPTTRCFATCSCGSDTAAVGVQRGPKHNWIDNNCSTKYDYREHNWDLATWHTKSCWNCTAVAETCLRLTWNCNAWQGDKVHDIVHYVHAAYRQMWHVHIHRIGEVRSTTVVKTADGQHAQKACVQMILSLWLEGIIAANPWSQHTSLIEQCLENDRS